MSPPLLFVALPGLVVTVVFGQNPQESFANPPPLPTEGTLTLTLTVFWGVLP